MAIADFWQPFEVTVNSFDELVEQINKVMAKSKTKNTRYAWRGLVNHEWALHSSLYRRLALTVGSTPKEADLAAREGQILADLHRWGLHFPSAGGRLSILNQLAMLQHFGAPTRLVDISFNAWVGVFFAVEEKWENGVLKHEDADGRLFVIDVTDRLINENAVMRSWEDSLTRPWTNKENFDSKDLRTWTSQVFAWKPPSLNGRISAQNGGFLLGGVPSSTTPTGKFQVPKSSVPPLQCWTIDETRLACCLALRPHLFDPKKGGVGSGALYTFRIKADAKADIRKRLEQMFGYNHASIYPDFSGFASFGTPKLRSY